MRRVASGLALLLLVVVTLPRSHPQSPRVVASLGPVSPVRVVEIDPTTTTTTTVAMEGTPSSLSARSRNRTGSGTAPSGDVWWRLALCESSGTNANTGNGFYGYFQFVPSTWRSLGYQGLPTDYGYDTQLEAAQALQARSGWGQWPVCSRRIGAA